MVATFKLVDIRLMVFTIKYTFHFFHGRNVGVIISDLYASNSISCFAERLSLHPEVGSFCCYKDGCFIIQFDCEK